MSDYRMVHCLFEQSGTFKNQFIKLGIKAEDYDIQDEFGQTDHVVDIFENIRGGYEHKPSIFDNMTDEDLILAFFPCTRFESRVPLWFRGQAQQQKNWTDFQKMEYSMNLHNELNEYYLLITKLVWIAKERNLKLIIENPYMQPHYLTTYWCFKPTLIDKDRTTDGDYYKKPTQYWFINLEPSQNLIFEPINYVPTKVIARVKKENGISVKTQRSMIHPQYANRFIRKYILKQQCEQEWELSENMKRRADND